MASATHPRQGPPTRPNLFLVGAPKCGTTSVFAWLMQHPEVFCPRRKEPHFYYNPYGQKPRREDYLDLYSEAGAGCRYAVDASVYYLSSPAAIEAIRDEVADAKFIVCLRNPVEMAPSLHWQKIHSGHEGEHDFARAWRLSDTRHAGGFDGIVNLPPSADPRHMAYKQVSFIGRQLADLLARVGRERVFICFIEDIATQPAQTFARLCAFLDIEAPAGVDFTPRNRAKVQRFPRLSRAVRLLGQIKRRLGVRRKFGIGLFLERNARIERRYARPDAALMREMTEAFAEDVALLQELTGRNLDHWRAPAPEQPAQDRR